MKKFWIINLFDEYKIFINYLKIIKNFSIVLMLFFDLRPDGPQLIAHWAFTTDVPLGITGDQAREIFFTYKNQKKFFSNYRNLKSH